MHIRVAKYDPIVADVLGMTVEKAGYFKTTADTIESALFELTRNPIYAILCSRISPMVMAPDWLASSAKTACPCQFWWCLETVPLMTRLPHLVSVPTDT